MPNRVFAKNGRKSPLPSIMCLCTFCNSTMERLENDGELRLMRELKKKEKEKEMGVHLKERVWRRRSEASVFDSGAVVDLA